MASLYFDFQSDSLVFFFSFEQLIWEEAGLVRSWNPRPPPRTAGLEAAASQTPQADSVHFGV